MTPAEHYAEAERLLAGGGENPMVDLVKAQVHATLATAHPPFEPMFRAERYVRFGEPLTCARCGHGHHIGPPDNRCTDPACNCSHPRFEADV